MGSRSQRPVLLNPRDTFEIYEKRSNSPLHHSAGWTTAGYRQQQQERYYQQPSTGEQYMPDGEYPIFSVKEEKKLPIGWIIGIAVAVPIFVILVLFLAVWLQEMGLI